MENQVSETGWVIMSSEGNIYDFTFKNLRTDSINRWNTLWDQKRTNWRKQKREGYSCVRAKQTTEIL